jgi:hypothetical protein
MSDEEDYNKAIDCPECKGKMHPYRKACHECETNYTRQELQIAIEETWMATARGGRSLDGITRLVMAKLHAREEH